MPAELADSNNKDKTAALRRECGIWLRALRDRANLSQRELSVKVGLEYYTFISQIEAGRGRIPPERYEAYAIALNMEPRIFVKEILRFYEPSTYEVLFGDEERPVTVSSVNDEESAMESLAKRLAALEAKLAL